MDGVEVHTTRTDSEWDDPYQAELLSAMAAIEADTGPHGLLMSEVTDPANQFAFEGTPPITDYYEKARLDYEQAYIKRHDSKANPLNRNGLIFGARRR